VAVINPPLWLQAGSYTARQDRRLISTLASTPGVAGPIDLFVSQRGAGANMSVDVLEGRAFIFGSEATTQGAYHVESQGDTNVVVAAAHATLPRYDLVVARVRDAEYSGATNAWALEVVTGTAAGSPAEPSPPVNSITLARITVAPAVTSIVNANILDRRPRARILGGVSVVTSSTLPSLLTGGPGEVAYATDIDSLYVRTASTWTPMGHVRVANPAPGGSIASLSYINLGSVSLPAGRWSILAKGMVFDPVGARQADLQLYNVTDAVELDVLSVYGQGPYRIGFTLMGTLTNTATKSVAMRGKVTSVGSAESVLSGKLYATAVSAII
jgi:hypothetical protein